MKFCKDCKHYGGVAESGDYVGYGVVIPRHQCAHPRNIRFHDPVTGDAYTRLSAHENRKLAGWEEIGGKQKRTLWDWLLGREEAVSVKTLRDPTCGPDGDWWEPTKVAD